MIIGNGLVAGAFKNTNLPNNVLIFASGPSDSKSSLQNEFEREINLLLETIENNPDKLLVYFSTASILDISLNKSDYCVHKLNIENIIKNKSKNYLILRISNIVSNTGNPKTIFNYFKNCIESGTPFELWNLSERNLIDISDLVKITLGLIKLNSNRKTMLVVNSKSILVSDLIELMEIQLNKKANYTIVKKGSKLELSQEVPESLLNELKIDFNEEYYEKLLKKYISRFIVQDKFS